MVEKPDPARTLGYIRKAGWLITGVGALGLLLAFGFPLEHQLRVNSESGRATGRVVDHVLDASASKYPRYVAVIEFTTASGAQQLFRTQDNWPGVGDRTGQDLPIAYDPADPRQATIDDIRVALYPLLGFGILGLVTLLSGTWVLTRFNSTTESPSGMAA